jgi:alpha-beta hydrolase superfamily lysophospholipase
MKRRAVLGLIAGLGLSACRPEVQTPGAPPRGFTGPSFSQSGSGPGVFTSFDGTRLPMQTWGAVDAGGEAVEPWAVIVALHGMNDYAEAFLLPAPYWAAQGITTYAYDQRGFGRTPSRGVWGGADLMTQDLRTAVALARAAHPKAVIAVVGESMGGAVAIAAFASDDPPAADRLVLAAPAVWGWDAQPLTYRVALWLTAHIAPASRVEAPDWLVRHILASDNIEELRRMGRDRNMIFRTRADTIYGLVSLMQEARQDLGRVRAPVLFQYGAHDQIIPKDAAVYAARFLKPTDHSAYYTNGYHLLTRDLGRRLVLDDIIAFLRNPSAPAPSGAPPIPTTTVKGTLAGER